MSSASAHGRAPVVLCAGIAVEDFLFKVERFPAAGRRRSQADRPGRHGRRLRRQCGGRGRAARRRRALRRPGRHRRRQPPLSRRPRARRRRRSGVAARRGRLDLGVRHLHRPRPARRWSRRAAARGSTARAPRDPDALVADIDVAAGRQPLSGFRAADLPGRAARGIPVGARRRQGDDNRRSAVRDRHPRDLLVGGAARDHRPGRPRRRRSRAIASVDAAASWP